MDGNSAPEVSLLLRRETGLSPSFGKRAGDGLFSAFLAGSQRFAVETGEGSRNAQGDSRGLREVHAQNAAVEQDEQPSSIGTDAPAGVGAAFEAQTERRLFGRPCLRLRKFLCSDVSLSSFRRLQEENLPPLASVLQQQYVLMFRSMTSEITRHVASLQEREFYNLEELLSTYKKIA